MSSLSEIKCKVTKQGNILLLFWCGGAARHDGVIARFEDSQNIRAAVARSREPTKYVRAVSTNDGPGTVALRPVLIAGTLSQRLLHKNKHFSAIRRFLKKKYFSGWSGGLQALYQTVLQSKNMIFW